MNPLTIDHDFLMGIHVIYDLGHVTIKDPKLPYWTGREFKLACEEMYELKGNFYLEGWDLLEDDKPLYLQGIPLYFCGFIFHESVRGSEVSDWCVKSRYRREGTMYYHERWDRKISDSKKTEE